ncbi:multidrug effflux MFS transporter [Acidisoma cellulosilytica]|uniref:Bcr/CflA family efflux transporter n=2 Tax=Acidisoma cellulosilyticum TaxID=2802395 RepID=A0A963Z2Q6_9PROT|nr:multidrug effflux MFS transporter [Acidisoma cellulosilyticum]
MPGDKVEVAKHGLRVLAILSALMGFASISTDLYLPALPSMARALRASPGMMELTISGFLVGFSLGQLLWGPIGDRYGRRMPIVAGLVLFIIGSVGCALSDSAWMMVSWRVVQAVGACASVVLARAIVRDLYEGARAAQMLSTLITVMAIAPLLGPILGGQILIFSSWPTIFWLLGVMGALTLAAVLTLPETLAPERRNHQPLGRAMLHYLTLVRRPQLLGYAGAVGFYYGGLYAYLAGTPFAYITYHHLRPQLYGLVFGTGIIGIMATNVINARIVARFGGTRLMRMGTAVAAVSALVIGLDAWTGWGGLAGLALPLFVFIGIAGFIVANAIAGALMQSPERAGTVSALVGAIQYGSGIISSGLVGAFADGTPWPMGGVILLCGLGSLACAWLLVPAPGKIRATV